MQTFPTHALSQAITSLGILTYVDVSTEEKEALAAQTISLIRRASLALGEPSGLEQCHQMASSLIDHLQRCGGKLTSIYYRQRLMTAEDYLAGRLIPADPP